MALSEQLRPASFRGVPFEVDAGEIEAGRRTQVHEYPKRDKAYPEDLGRATRSFTVAAYVVGADYVERANRLLAAVEEAGPGTLVHPWLGTMRVSLNAPARISFDRDLGLARAQLSFVEEGELTFPTAANATASQSRLAAQGLETAAAQSFAESFTVDGLPDHVAESASEALGNAFDVLAGGPSFPGDQVIDYANTASAALARARGYMNNPLLLATDMMEFLGLSDLSGAQQRWGDVARSLLRLASNAGLAYGELGAFATPSRRVAQVNTQAVRALTRQGLIAQAVGASSFVGSTADVSPAQAYDDLLGVRNDLISAIDAESLVATSDATYDALQVARSRVWEDLTTRSRSSARLTTVRPPAPLPALVLAYDLYEDAARDDEIVMRNRVSHPGFVPPRELLVLTR